MDGAKSGSRDTGPRPPRPAECLDEDTLLALLDGKLAPEERAAVEEHLSSCESCLRLFAVSSGNLAGGGDPATPEATPTAESAHHISRYRVTGPIGAGGAGVVYAAWDPELGRPVALKLLHAESRAQPEGKSRVLREAQAMARLTHPNVVAVHDVGTSGEQVFIAMELVEGGTLRAWQTASPRSWREILRVYLAAGRGLAAAHAAGLVHRDFKPENVLVAPDGRVLVTDFGLARQAHGETEPAAPANLTLTSGSTPDATLTPIGSLVGTPAYMAPEQLDGQPATASSDLFAFCVALYEALFAARPFSGKTVFALRGAIGAGAVEWPQTPRIPRWLRRELARGLRADPDQRHPGMTDLLSALDKGMRPAPRSLLWLAPALALSIAAAFVGARARSSRVPRSLAVLEPRNATPGDTDWISSVLVELVSGALTGDPRVQLVPASEASTAAADLGLRGATLGSGDLPRLRTRLAADLVLSGSYSLSPDHRLTCELTLWDSQGNPKRLTASGDEARLIDLGLQLGAEARSALGMRAEAAPSGAAVPSNLQAARLYAEGLQLLRNREPSLARAPLAQAATLVPDNPRVQLAIAEANSALRADDPTRKASQRALQFKEGLGPDEQRRAEILYRRNSGDSARAVELARAAHEAAPENLQRGLDYGDELIYARKWQDALSVCTELHKLPAPAGNDARIDILEARAAWPSGDIKRCAAAAERAYGAAEQRGARWQMAVARNYGARSLRRLGDPSKALEMFQDAEALYAAVGDKGSAAATAVVRAQLVADGGDIPRARAIFEAALSTYQEIGDRAAEGVILENLGELMGLARDLPAALSFAGRATTLNLELGQLNVAAGSMTTMGNLRLAAGDLSGAAEALTRASEIRRQDKTQQLIEALYAFGRVRLLQADLAEAHRLLEEARGADNGQDKWNTGSIRLLDAQLGLAEKRFEEASTNAALAAALFKQGATLDDEAVAEGVHARALLGLGRTSEARAAADRAAALIANSKSEAARAPVAVASALVQAAEHPRTPAEALSSLRAVLDAATRAGARDEEWQVRLASAQIELRSGKRGARSALLALARDARAEGMHLYAQQAEETARENPPAPRSRD